MELDLDKKSCSNDDHKTDVMFCHTVKIRVRRLGMLSIYSLFASSDKVRIRTTASVQHTCTLRTPSVLAHGYLLPKSTVRGLSGFVVAIGDFSSCVSFVSDGTDRLVCTHVGGIRSGRTKNFYAMTTSSWQWKLPTGLLAKTREFQCTYDCQQASS